MIDVAFNPIIGKAFSLLEGWNELMITVIITVPVLIYKFILKYEKAIILHA